MNTLSMPIDAEIIGELFLRRGVKADISGWVENIIQDYLDRTADDGNWQEAYYDYRDGLMDRDTFEAEYGNTDGGYHWAPLFLPNGTLIRMEYKKEIYNAVVKFDEVRFNEKRLSPSELAREIASGTSRNAWRDLMIKRPTDTEWTLADDLRKRRAV